MWWNHSKSKHHPHTYDSATTRWQLAYNGPPEWTASAQPSHDFGLINEASEESYEKGEEFCRQTPVEQPHLIDYDTITKLGGLALTAQGNGTGPASHWEIEQLYDLKKFFGNIVNTNGVAYVQSWRGCGDTCLMSNLPIIAAYYRRAGQRGIYYEITLDEMDVANGAVVAIGAAARPYPSFRLPGWNRQSIGLHLDDGRTFFENPEGGYDYAPEYMKNIVPGDVFGFGFEFSTGEVFFTRNGGRLPRAFVAAQWMARGDAGLDVYAAIGVCNQTKVRVNFGAWDFSWKEGNLDEWKTEKHVGVLEGGGKLDELPGYQRAPVV